MKFPKMAEIVPESKIGDAAVDHYAITILDAMRDTFYGIPTEPGKVAGLRIRGKLVMSDSYHEKRSNSWAVWQAKGDCLVAGLGLGMILHPILASDKVSSVTVVEKEADVIALISPTLCSEKLTIVNADIFEWKPAKGTKYDMIYFDIWPDLSLEYLPEMSKLHQRFKSYKKPGAYMASWCREEMRRR